MKAKVALSTLTLFTFLCAFSAAQVSQESFTWKRYRPTNTGIQGDWNDALWVGPDGNPWIGGYDPGFEEGGIAQYIVKEDRWVNVSNVDYPVIGHPEFTGTSRISDIDTDSQGRMWMATARGGLMMDPEIGPKSLVRFGPDNSGIYGGWNKGVEVAPDGTVWFSSYSTVWGDGGISVYNPTTRQWRNFADYGGGTLAIQPQPGGYYVWTQQGEYTVARFDSRTQAWTVIPKGDGQPAVLPEKNLTDSAGNTWMYKWTNATMNEFRLDLRRPNGTWANIPEFPMGLAIAAIRAKGPDEALIADGGGGAWRYKSGVWQYLDDWVQAPNSYDIDEDAKGNIWICGSGGAARRDAQTGVWQRYRITNTSQYDFFNNDLSIDPSGGIIACANASAGYGGMVRFDGQRWIGFNNHHYGKGVEWPFNTDNSQRVYVRPSNGDYVINPTFHFLHSYQGGTWTDLNSPIDSPKAVMEDRSGKLWMGAESVLYRHNGTTFDQIPGIGGSKLIADPVNPTKVWTLDQGTIARTDGTTTQTWTEANFSSLTPGTEFLSGLAVDSRGFAWMGVNTAFRPGLFSLIWMNPNTGAHKRIYPPRGMTIPGEVYTVLGVSPDNKVWCYYDSEYPNEDRGIFWFDGKRMGAFAAPAGGAFTWGGLPHAAILDFEIRPIRGGYEIWMSCASRGIAVLTVRQNARR